MKKQPSVTRSSTGSAVRALICLFLALALAACASAPKKEVLTLSLQATADVNPDLQGRPSPVVVHILELKSTEQFNSLDYMSLTDPNGASLGADLVNRSQVVLSPGGTHATTLELDPAVTSIGFVAGYRDIDNATWRLAVPITQGQTKSVNVTLGQVQMTAAPAN